MRTNYAVLGILVLVKTALAGTDLSDVIAHPKNYNGHRLELIGIARVPGEFFLFADPIAAAKINKDVSKALYLRQQTPGEPDYSNLDRQWVRVSGILRADAHGRGESPAEINVETVQKLEDRPPPQIKDPDVWGLFRNDTSLELRVETQGESFWIGPGKCNEVVIQPGPIEVFTLKPKSGAAPWERDKDKQIAAGEIKFNKIKEGYDYSPAHSAERTIYYRIAEGRVEEVSRAEAQSWCK
jgi:hypothetical protein